MPKNKKYSISALKTLLTFGEVEKDKLSLDSSIATKLNLSLSSDGKRYVANQFLLKLIAQGASEKELLATITELIETGSETNNPLKRSISDVDPLNAGANQHWCQDRLLLTPGIARKDNKSQSSSVLCGGWKSLPSYALSPSQEETMDWVLSSPWAFLLAQLVFTQEVWAAERNAGYLTLDLSRDCKQYFYKPKLIKVGVALSNNVHVICGSLGELLLKVLEWLGVSLFPHNLPASVLDTKLSLLIEQLLKFKVWQFFNDTYMIDSRFSDSCYRIIGTKRFATGGLIISNAIRDVSIHWATEKLPRISFKYSSYRF